MPNFKADFSLLLVEICEPRNNDLRLKLLELRPASEPTETVLGQATQLRPDQDSRGFELNWYAYVAYVVRNESYNRGEVDEPVAKDGFLSVRKNSAFLNYVGTTTFATKDFPGELKHWSLWTEWHCIDVVGVEPPEVRQLSQTEVAALIDGLG